jgi:hypothetical protein
MTRRRTKPKSTEPNVVPPRFICSKCAGNCGNDCDDSNNDDYCDAPRCWCYEFIHEDPCLRPCVEYVNGVKHYCNKCQAIIDQYLIDTDNIPTSELPRYHPRRYLPPPPISNPYNIPSLPF